MKYPKAFEKWYAKNLANRGIVDYDKGEEVLKSCCFLAWKAAAVSIEKKIKKLDKGASVYDGHWQHEHTDWTLEYIKELYK